MMAHDISRQPAISAPPRRWLGLVALALIVLVSMTSGYYTLRGLSTRDVDEEQEAPPITQIPNHYLKWEKPLLAIVATGQMHGYVDPCGCSSPQYGGLVRRFNFIESLRAKGWDTVAVDLGELAQLQGVPEQILLKYDLSMKALSAMNYRAVGIGKHEILAPLGSALAQTWDKNREQPRPLALSLDKTAPGQLYHGLNVRPFEIISPGGNAPKVGVISMMGPDMRERFKNEEKFVNNQVELPKALDAFAAAGVEIGIILHHEHPSVPNNVQGIDRLMAIEKKRKELAEGCAKFCAQERARNRKIPPIQLMMILTDESEPPDSMKQLDVKPPTHAIEIGHKGIYVGLVGIYRDAKTGFRMEYQIVKMGPEWETPAAKKAGHPVIKLMDGYHQELKRQDILAKPVRSPDDRQRPAQNAPGLKATYIGSEACYKCHEHAYEVWMKKTAHHGATETLEKLTHPSGRHFDPECMQCHTTGFKHPGGYNDPIPDLAKWKQPAPGFKHDAKALAAHNPKLRGVGCESCHGPGSEHIKKPRDPDLKKLINPYAPTKEERDLEKKLGINPESIKDVAKLGELFDTRMRHLSRFCTACHDAENDVNWFKDGDRIVEKWLGKGIIHRTPKDKDGAVQPPARVNPPEAKASELPAIIIGIIEKK